MARRRFFADSLEGSAATLRGAQAVHVATVLRARAGQQYELAFAGRLYLGTITAANADLISFRVDEELPDATAAAPRIELGAAVFKFDRLEWMLEKATELGATRITLLETRRTEPELLAGAPRKLERWRRILMEAAQQSRRTDAPELIAPIPLAAFLAAGPAERIFLVEEPGPPMLRNVLGGGPATTLVTGPVGGWAPEERAQAVAAGFSEASLGPRVLRCETAILTALAQLA